jgi:hypothetical protein
MTRSNLVSASINPCTTSSSAASISADFRQSNRQDQQRAATFFFGARWQIDFVQWSQQLEKKPITGLNGTLREFVTSSVVEFASETTNFWACTSPHRIQALRGKKICSARGVQKPIKDMRWLLSNLAIQGKETTHKGYKKDQVHSSRSAYRRQNKARRSMKITDYDTYSNRKRVHVICLLHGKRKRKNKSVY